MIFKDSNSYKKWRERAHRAADAAVVTGKLIKTVARRTFTNANQTDYFPDMKKKKK